MKKEPGDIIILNMSTKNYDQMMYMVPERRCAMDGKMEGWMDGQTDAKSDI